MRHFDHGHRPGTACACRAHRLDDKEERRACITMRQLVSWYARKLPPCRDFLERMRNLASAADYYANIEMLNDHLVTLKPRPARQVA